MPQGAVATDVTWVTVTSCPLNTHGPLTSVPRPVLATRIQRVCVHHPLRLPHDPFSQGQDPHPLSQEFCFSPKVTGKSKWGSLGI